MITSGNGTAKTKLAMKDAAVIAISALRRMAFCDSRHKAVMTIASTAAFTPKKMELTATAC